MNWILPIILVLIAAGGFTFYFYRPKKQKRTESIYTHALNAMGRGDTRTALKHFRDVVKQDTNHIDAYLQMGDIQLLGNLKYSFLLCDFSHDYSCTASSNSHSSPFVCTLSSDILVFKSLDGKHEDV